MKFIETKLKGAYIIEIEPFEDKRGSFARTFCQEEFEKMKLNPDIIQCNISHNKKAGTVRGMHFQKVPYEETKIVSCIKGLIYDVIVDLRKDSPTYKQWVSVELSAENQKMLYIPEGFAHGFQTLVDDTIVYYQMGTAYRPEYSAGIKWNDPVIGIQWPEVENRIISDKDINLGGAI